MSLVSSRQAASLLNVHESSIKRWCNSEELACSYTAGGHRRLDLDDILGFARQQHLECILLPFENEAVLVWNGANEMKAGRNIDVLVVKMREWLLHAESRKLMALLHLCGTLDIPYARVFDSLIGKVMADIGDAWARGAFEIGDEHRISECLMDVLYGIIATLSSRNGMSSRKMAIVGCGPNEDHATGALMVRILLLARGWNVVYLGRNVPVEDLVLYQRRHRADLIAVSMSSHREPPEIRQFIKNVTSLQRDDLPFDLAIGGSGAASLSETQPWPLATSSVKTFVSAEDFDDWLEVRYAK